MALTSQGHLRAEHLEWSVTLQTESNNQVFSGLWRWLFILSLTLMPFDQAHESNGLNSLISSFFSFPVFTLCLGTSCHFHSLSHYSCHFSSRMFRSGQWQGVYTRKQWNERERNACRTRMANLLPYFLKTTPLIICLLCCLEDLGVTKKTPQKNTCLSVLTSFGTWISPDSLNLTGQMSGYARLGFSLIQAFDCVQDCHRQSWEAPRATNSPKSLAKEQ